MDTELAAYYAWLRFPARERGDEKPHGWNWMAYRLMRDLDERLTAIETQLTRNYLDDPGKY